MPTAYGTEGYVILSGVSFTGTEGAPGSTLNWTGLTGQSDINLSITDQDDNGSVNVGMPSNSFTPDYFGNFALGLIYSGYTISSGGTEYGVFTDGTNYYVPLDEDGTTQTTIPTSGSSNAQQDSASAFLCFAPGSMIATPDGSRAVETLGIGDTILTQDGRPVPVRWIGRQAVSVATAGARMQPVRLRAGCLGGGLPEQDLTVTADHGMVIDGLVVNASALVNGSTIDWLPASELPEQLTFYHVETEAHDVILANGAPSETFIDYRDRQSFDNYDEYLDLYGCERIIPEMPRPRISSRRQLPAAIRERLDQGIAAQRDDRETRRA
ncbi:Hint domain-containing protein [Mameliella alba]|uniref:Hint domain-containing protein n=1 Tax=Mameliella alba TaxID=561184 RepID=UPI000885DB01|nr:Hint domain-containing protein [Mameliella alba]OWV49767.1 hypothetical protein CDZ96_05175 [Mameliella alba]PTR41763.1 Hint domain-containing protein [Mameliella alba]GGF54296.1 hypothetical protein GCM10011319_14580 [Mameliella alba]SDC31519.1 Hint domain-containing protein [Mameliella alba]